MFLQNELIYSLLLGSRLFLSPHQLLKDIHQFTKEETMKKSTSSSPCTKCHRMHQIASSPKPYMKRVMSPNVTSFHDDVIRSSTPTGSYLRRATTLNTISSADISPGKEHSNEPIMRQRRGRSRLNPVRDSGIGSGTYGNFLSPSGYYSNRYQVDIDGLLPSNDIGGGGMQQYVGQDFVVSVAPSSFAPPSSTRRCCPIMRMLHVLHQWVLHFPADFRNKKVLWALNSIMETYQIENEVSYYCAVKH